MKDEKELASVKDDSPPVRTFCTFHLRNGLYGIDALAVKEITVMPPITPIPHASPEVRGYVNLRGQIVLVLDSNCILSGIASTLGPDSRLIVCRAHLGDPFGILVDRIGDIWELSCENIEKYANGAAAGNIAGCIARDELIFGVGKLEACLLTIIDAGKLLPSLETALELFYNKSSR
jgi:purine-binding chemotaxis protein CheW